VSEWAFLRLGFAAVGLLVVAALAGWAIEAARYEDRGFQELSRCLVEEKGATIRPTRDPIARSADLGALDTVIETNPVTVSVSSTPEQAGRIVSSYRAVGGELGLRVEQRGRTVYLWARSPSPTQRQAMFNCTY
jgi:hypothetical protein